MPKRDKPSSYMTGAHRTRPGLLWPVLEIWVAEPSKHYWRTATHNEWAWCRSEYPEKFM